MQANPQGKQRTANTQLRAEPTTKTIKIDEYEGMATYNIIKILEQPSLGPGGKMWESVSRLMIFIII